MKGKYIPTIGLEIHAQLATKTKMFCDSPNNSDETRPNVNICPVCMAHPGTLPVINKAAVEAVIKVGLALGGRIANFTEFDRKNYFYPDIPKGYQISQYKYPIVSGGELVGVKITRVHLEEDTAISIHKADGTLIDFNRAGVPLMELVTEPVIRSAEEASAFARELKLILKYLGVSEANMEKGELRVEANISVSADPKKFGTKVEVKNLNSFKAVERAIKYEIERMTDLLVEGRGSEIIQETRGWDEDKQVTFSQRRKEYSEDYRYFPEPDLPKLYLYEIFDLAELKKNLPELPVDKRERYAHFGLKSEDIEIFIDNPMLAQYFEAIVAILKEDKEKTKLASNYITSDLLGHLKKRSDFTLPSPANFATLIEMISAGKVSSRGAKDILEHMHGYDDSPQKIAEEHGLLQQSDEGALRAIAEKIVAVNQSVVADYKTGKEAALQYLVGQMMRESKGAANPQVAKKIFLEILT